MNEIICRECHSPNKSGSKFCSHCGASLKPATHIICPNCYHRNPLHLLYCDNCGTRLIKQPTRPLGPLAEPEEEVEFPSSARVFSLPSRNPGETGDLDPDSLPEWLKTGVDPKAAVPAEDDERLSDWLSDLQASGEVSEAHDLGELNLDWLNEPVGEPDVPEKLPTAAPTPAPSDEPAPDEALDWLTAMENLGDAMADDPTGETPTGFTGWLSPEAIEETAAQFRPAPTPEPEEEDEWLNEVENDTFISEDSGRTGFTGWLESKRLNPSDAGFDDEDEDEFTREPNDPIPPAASSGFTGWLDEQDLLDEPIDLDAPSRGQATTSEGASGFTSWLSDQGLTAEEESAAPPATASDEDDVFDWLDPEAAEADDEDDEEALRQEMVGTGFTGWLNPATLDEIEEKAESESTAAWSPSPTSSELPDWLDTGELTSLDDEEEEEEIGTGFTGWLNPQIVADMESSPSTAEPEAEPEAPDWLLAGPDDDEEDSAGTGFTDWLANKGSGEEAEGEDEGNDFGWMEEEEEVVPQELMTPLSKEEAHKILENTPDVSEEFIEEVVQGDFPDWLTEVKTNEDAISTDVLPAWISAPLSTTDELELGLRPSGASATADSDTEDDDDWLSGLSTPSMATGDDSWMTDLGSEPTTAEADDDDWLSGMSLEAEASPTGEDEPITAQEQHAEDVAWLASMPDTPTNEIQGGDDDWLADIQPEAGVAGGTDLLQELAGAGANDDWDLVELGGDSLTGLEWMDEGAITEEPVEDPLAAFLTEDEPEVAAEPDEFAFLTGEDEGSSTAAQDTEASFDWLGALGDADIEPAREQAIADRQSWLQGADLGEDEEEPAESAGGRELDEALLTTIFTSRPQPPPADSSTTDIAQLVSNLRDEEDEFADEEIFSELEAMGQTDGLDEGIVDDYEEELFISAANAASGDLLTDMGLADPSLQQKQKSGPLAGLIGVVPVASVVSGLVAPAHVGTGTANPAQEEQVALLRQITRQNGHALTATTLDDLLGSEMEATPTRRVDWVQMVLGLLLIAAVIGGLLLPNLVPTTPPTAAPGLIGLENHLAMLRGQTVLVVFDYTPATAGELSPAATLLLENLVQNNNQLVTMSQYPTGLATAAPLLGRLPETAVAGSLGYVPGESLGLRQLAGCLNGTLCATADLPPIAAVLLLTGDRDSLQNWMEQVAPEVEQPVLAAVTQAIGPAAQPYLTSGQLDGLIGGLPATALHEQHAQTGTTAQDLHQSQALAHLLAIAVLVLGAIIGLVVRPKTNDR